MPYALKPCMGHQVYESFQKLYLNSFNSLFLIDDWRLLR